MLDLLIVYCDLKQLDDEIRLLHSILDKGDEDCGWVLPFLNPEVSAIADFFVQGLRFRKKIAVFG